jgi:hypothetical protein
MRVVNLRLYAMLFTRTAEELPPIMDDNDRANLIAAKLLTFAELDSQFTDQ